MIDDVELEFIQRIENEFDNVTCNVSSYPDAHGNRVKIITDQYGDELARLTCTNKCIQLYLTISNELFTRIHNWDRQFERFWLALYDKYKISKNIYYKKHNVKRIY